MRKQTPPVSSELPPTALPIITLMTGVSPSGTAKVSPASRHSVRICVVGRMAP